MHRPFWLTVTWTARLVYLCFLLLVVLKYLLSSEQQQCNELLQAGGRWLDPPAAQKPTTWKKWQPNADCVLHHYQTSDVEQCLGNKHVFFAGDSIVRNPFVELAHMFGRGDVQKQPHGLDFHLQLGSVEMHFLPDDYVNRTETLDKIAEANAHPGSDSKHPGDLIMVGAGLWFRREFRPNWMEVMQQYMDPILRSTSEHPSSDRAAWIVNTVPIPKAGTPDKARAGWFTNKEAATAEMNDYLQDAVGDHSRGKVAKSFSTMNLDEGAMRDTVHTIDKVAAARMNLLLNYHCNAAVLDPAETPGTCCTTMRPQFAHYLPRLVLLVIIAWRLRRLSLDKRTWNLNEPRAGPATSTIARNISGIVLVVVACLAADQTSLFGRHLRPASTTAFLTSLLALALVAILTIRRHQDRVTTHHTDSSHDAALGSCKGWIVVTLILNEVLEVRSLWENAEHIHHACLLALVFILGYNAAELVARRFPDTSTGLRHIIAQLAHPTITIFLVVLALAPPTVPALVAIITFWPALASVLLAFKFLTIDLNFGSLMNRSIIITSCKSAIAILTLICITAFLRSHTTTDIPEDFTTPAYYILTAIPALDAGIFYSHYRHSTTSSTSTQPPTTSRTRSILYNTTISLLLTTLFILTTTLTPEPSTLHLGTANLIAALSASLLISSFIVSSRTGYHSSVTSWIGAHSLEILLLYHPLLLSTDHDATILYSGVVRWAAQFFGMGTLIHPDAALGVEMVFDAATVGLCAWALGWISDMVKGSQQRSSGKDVGTGTEPVNGLAAESEVGATSLPLMRS